MAESPEKPNNILKAHNCEEGKCQMKSRARIINETDPRNVYTMACMMWAFCALLASCMCYNWDATQFLVSPDVANTVVYIKSDHGHEDVRLKYDRFWQDASVL